MTFKRKKEPEKPALSVVQTGQGSSYPFKMLDGYVPLASPQLQMFSALREAVPVIDAAITKLVRMTGGFKVTCTCPEANSSLDRFVRSISVGGNQFGLDSFISTYFEQLLTYGTALGEIITDSSGRVAALYNAPLENIELKRNKNGLDIDICVVRGGQAFPIKYPQLVLISALNPDPGALAGNSMLKGLPFVSSILLKIFNTIGLNWERVGNVRFAVTYKPQNDAVDRAYAKDRALQVAKEWGEAMQAGSSIKDFVAVGDVSIKVIGADNQILDSEVPVRQILEQIVSKTGLPPFMLGLSWSTTERMSSQQADALTSELEAFRRVLTPVIEKICGTFIRLEGFSGSVNVEWSDITMQDQVEVSKAKLYEAQAKSLLNQIHE